jgi:hypothetical protein
VVTFEEITEKKQASALLPPFLAVFHPFLSLSSFQYTVLYITDCTKRTSTAAAPSSGVSVAFTKGSDLEKVSSFTRREQLMCNCRMEDG